MEQLLHIKISKHAKLSLCMLTKNYAKYYDMSYGILNFSNNMNYR